jgi:hypothetical protein
MIIVAITSTTMGSRAPGNADLGAKRPKTDPGQNPTPQIQAKIPHWENGNTAAAKWSSWSGIRGQFGVKIRLEPCSGAGSFLGWGARAWGAKRTRSGGAILGVWRCPFWARRHAYHDMRVFGVSGKLILARWDSFLLAGILVRWDAAFGLEFCCRPE